MVQNGISKLFDLLASSHRRVDQDGGGGNEPDVSIGSRARPKPKVVAFHGKGREMRGQNESSEDETEDMIEVDEGAPAAPQPRRTEISTHLIKYRIVATKIQHSQQRRGSGKRP